MEKNDLDVRNQNTLIDAFIQADDLLMKKYINNLSDYKVVPINPELKNKNVSSFTRLFKVDRIVYNKNENNQDKILNVYNSLYSCNGSVVLIMDSNGESVDFYIGAKAIDGFISPCQSVLTKALKGNFPGTRIDTMKNPEIDAYVNGLFGTNYESTKKSISAVTGISSFRSEKDTQNIGFVQGIEKIVDSMRGEKYSFVIIADSIAQTQIDTIRSGYEALYTQLAPFASTELSFSENECSAITDSLTRGVSNSMSENLSKTHTYSEGSSKTRNVSKQSGKNFGASIIVLSIGAATSKTVTEGGTENWNKSDAEAISSGKTITDSEQSGKANTYTDGHSRSIQIKMENKSVKVLLEKIDEQLKRLNECNDLGMWNCSTYVIADDMQTSKVLASAYQALMRGENSGVENSAVTTWIENEKLSDITDYLKKLSHPLIDIENAQPLVSPGSLISGNELTIAAGFPQKSIPGLAVYEFTAFGREIISHDRKNINNINIGKIQHMGNDDNINVGIDCQSLASHTFITGSTGSGKSNTVYNILNELNKKGIPFLVIEPAKGEYKHVFGNKADVSVFGTNPYKTPMLRINPFKFPKDIHVLEHIDRLIEIFNVCWPMYAAMPAVLKEAVEEAYKVAGWDLDNSINCYGDAVFPCFIDVLEQLNRVIIESDFSQEVKSNYIGALVTRIKSLTNGINGQVFVPDEINNDKLFNSNTIIDLSRVASTETKAMIMGILVMRLQEFRISEGGMNKSIRHITVLEEAHNLLKRTSTEQVSEGANLLGKSVEMLANSIAEMRTYGEGFIIADQSPNMLDLSAIRNTNTKIILRLPDLADRELVGRAASLNDDQISELAKLSTGVAAVYQNNWLEPVLCHVEKNDTLNSEYKYMPKIITSGNNELKGSIVRYLLSNIVGDKIDYDIDVLKEKVFKSNLPINMKLNVVNALNKKETRTISDVSGIVAKLFYTEKLFNTGRVTETIEDWNRVISTSVGLNELKLESYYNNVVIQCLLKEASVEDNSLTEMYEKWTCKMGGRIL